MHWSWVWKKVCATWIKWISVNYFYVATQASCACPRMLKISVFVDISVWVGFGGVGGMSVKCSYWTCAIHSLLFIGNLNVWSMKWLHCFNNLTPQCCRNIVCEVTMRYTSCLRPEAVSIIIIIVVSCYFVALVYPWTRLKEIGKLIRCVTYMCHFHKSWFHMHVQANYFCVLWNAIHVVHCQIPQRYISPLYNHVTS